MVLSPCSEQPPPLQSKEDPERRVRSTSRGGDANHYTTFATIEQMCYTPRCPPLSSASLLSSLAAATQWPAPAALPLRRGHSFFVAHTTLAPNLPFPLNSGREVMR